MSSHLIAVVGRSVEKRTLGTKDVAQAQKLHAEALFAVEARWRNLGVGLF